jgi:K+-sensing histidine kinase KdpD
MSGVRLRTALRVTTTCRSNGNLNRKAFLFTASRKTFISFDFFLVPPLFSLVMYRVEEWVALCIFLITAILTGQQAIALRQRAEQASRREQETHTLYDLMRATNQATEPEQQLHVIAQAVVKVLSPWGGNPRLCTPAVK